MTATNWPTAIYDIVKVVGIVLIVLAFFGGLPWQNRRPQIRQSRQPKLEQKPSAADEYRNEE